MVPKCPEYTSQRVWKDGVRYTRHGDVQRYLCRNCGYRFSKNGVRDPVEPLRKSSSWSINRASAYSLDRQVCELLTEGSKNLVKVETRTEKQAAGATSAEVKGKIIEYAWNLKRNGYAESTITTYSHLLSLLVKRGANLNDPISIKDVIAMQETWSQGRRRNAVKAYNIFAKMQGISWQKPNYKPVEKLPFIPTEKEIDELITASSKQMATYLQLLKETGARRGEAFNLKWIDIDFVTKTVRITPEKGSEARIFRISDRLTKMLTDLPKTSERVWIYKNVFYLDKGFRRMRKRTAQKLGNPRMLQIHFHTFRHWKATIEYARTKDILYVKQLLGHRNIKTTLRYIQLVNLPQEEKFICKVAKDANQATELIEAGFEYVTGEYDDGGKLFRKRKLSYLGSSSIPVGSWSSLV